MTPSPASRFGGFASGHFVITALCAPLLFFSPLLPPASGEQTVISPLKFSTQLLISLPVFHNPHLYPHI